MFRPDPKPTKEDKPKERKAPKLGKRKCANCGERFQKLRPLQATCSVECAIQYSRDQEDKKKEREWKAKKKEGLEQLKSYAQRVQEARKVFQEYIRLRDKHLPCISCNEPPREQSNYWDGGHYFKAELYSGLIFNEINCNKQCKRCNNYDQGNGADYRIGLIAKYGEDAVIELESIKDEKREYRYSNEELDEFKAYYRKKIKELKNQYGQ